MKRNNNGFTLVELLIVIVILGIISAVAIPNVLSWIPEHHLRGASRELYDNMQFARMSAIKAREDCYINFNSPSDNQYSIKMDALTLKTVKLEDHASDVVFSSAPDSICFKSNGLADAENSIEVANSSKKYKATVFISGSVKLEEM